MSKRNHYFVDEILIPSENLNSGTHGLAQLSKVQEQLSTESNVWKNSTLDKTNSLVIWAIAISFVGARAGGLRLEDLLSNKDISVFFLQNYEP